MKKPGFYITVQQILRLQLRFIKCRSVIILLVAVFILYVGCLVKGKKEADRIFGKLELPTEVPIPFMLEEWSSDSIVHRGVLNPDYDEYYYTISDSNFQNFTVKVIKNKDGIWGGATDAFFNTMYSEHGMSFSPDGNTLYFSSTRPVHTSDRLGLWRIWRSQKIDNRWSEPEWINFPGLDMPLHSHPTIDEQGNLFFHASNSDYSAMNVYQTEIDQDTVGVPTVVGDQDVFKCTPYVSADGSLLFYGLISDPMNLVYSRRLVDGSWSPPNNVVTHIKNTRHQGNPFLTADGRFLFFAIERTVDPRNWNIYWMQGPK